MYRLVDDAFSEDKELHDLAVFCLTETIKSHLETYFKPNYELGDMLHTYVNLESALALLPKDMLDDMASIGVIPEVFICKKLAQLMTILHGSEEVTPDIFIELLLFAMIQHQQALGWEIREASVQEQIPTLKKKLRTYAKETLDISDTKERNDYIKRTVAFLTEFTELFGWPGTEDESLTFWDWDFSFFTDWGFAKTIREAYNGVLLSRGYGEDYTKDIFLSVGEDFPLQ